MLILFGAFCFVAGVSHKMFIERSNGPDVRRLPRVVWAVVNLLLAPVTLAAVLGARFGRSRQTALVIS